MVRPGVTKEKLQKDVDATINNYLGKELESATACFIKRFNK